MTRNEGIFLHESMPSDVGPEEHHDTEQNASHADQADSRQYESNRKRARVLVGVAILQLPIWGRLSSMF
jgi:hypothetical protein